VHAGANLDPQAAEGLDDDRRAPDGAARLVEEREEPVAGGVDLAAAEALQRAPDGRMTLCEQAPPLFVAQLCRALGGSDDVGEQHGRERRSGASVRRGMGECGTRGTRRQAGLQASRCRMSLIRPLAGRTVTRHRSTVRTEEGGMLTEEHRVVREASRYWWVFLVSGAAWLLISWMVLRANATSITTVGVLIGVVFLIAGINEAGMAAVVPGGWKVWHYVMAFIFILGGLWGFIRPVNTFFALASVLGLILFLYGLFEIILAFSSRVANPYWWLNLIAGILLILLAFWVSGSDRVYALQQRTYLILFWVGFFALFRGFTQIMLAFSVRHAGKEVEARTA
jgi:hypothetical protein